jgi:hypothetical protein
VSHGPALLPAPLGETRIRRTSPRSGSADVRSELPVTPVPVCPARRPPLDAMWLATQGPISSCSGCSLTQSARENGTVGVVGCVWGGMGFEEKTVTFRLGGHLPPPPPPSGRQVRSCQCRPALCASHSISLFAVVLEGAPRQAPMAGPPLPPLGKTHACWVNTPPVPHPILRPPCLMTCVRTVRLKT